MQKVEESESEKFAFLWEMGAARQNAPGLACGSNSLRGHCFVVTVEVVKVMNAINNMHSCEVILHALFFLNNPSLF